MLGHQSPKETLETYADLFDTDLDALADLLDHARTAALNPSLVVVASDAAAVDDRGSAEENVRALNQIAIAEIYGL
jgi:hypothetical protein